MSDLPAGAVEANGNVYMRDAQGNLRPIELIKPQDRLEDDLVRRLFEAALKVAAALKEFKGTAFAEVDALNDILASKYGAPKGGEKGNVTLATIDGCMQLKVQVADLIRFGPELQQAKALVDECVQEWSADSQAELRAIVMNAFQSEKEGQVNRAALLGLRKLDIADPRWKRAMEAIDDSIEILGTKRYIRFYMRPNHKAPWTTLSLDVATA